MTDNRLIKLGQGTLAAGVGLMLAALLAQGCAPGPTPSVPPAATQTTLVGDDNGDGHIDEDESGWDCNVHGNKICGTQQDGE